MYEYAATAVSVEIQTLINLPQTHELESLPLTVHIQCSLLGLTCSEGAAPLYS